MRFKLFKLLTVAACVVLSGCSAGRALAPSSGSHDSHSEHADYNSDPPVQRHSGRVAIEPNLVPPVQDISHIRGISYIKQMGHSQSGCTENACAADPGCVAPGGECTSEGCGIQGGSRRGCLSGIGNIYRNSFLYRSPRPLCVAPENGCSSDAMCGEAECQTPRARYRELCPCPEPVCVPESRCGEVYSQPPYCSDCCETEGCCDSPSRRRGLLSCLLDHVRFNHCWWQGSRCGDYCVPPSSCGDEGCCSDSFGCDDQVTRNGDCRPSPLADCMADPFVRNNETSVEAPPGQPVIPTEPATPLPAPNRPIDIEDGPLPPDAGEALKPTPLSPVPGTPIGQAFVEPTIWPRLKAKSVATETRIPRTHPTGWRL